LHDKNLKDNSKEEGFWRRQFSIKTTPYRTTFDIIVGLLLPVLCLVFDPLFFRSFLNQNGIGNFTGLQLFVYIGVALALFALTLWLILGEHTKSWAGFFTGIFYTSAIFSVSIGIVMVPFSLIGLIFFGVGILGGIPFLIALVFFRNGRRTLFLARQHLSSFWLSSSLVLGILFTTIIPFFVQWQTAQVISQSVQQVIWEDTETSQKASKNLDYLYTTIPVYTKWRTSRVMSEAIKQFFEGNLAVTEKEVQRLKYIDWCDICFDEIVWAYGRETDVGERHVLATVYKDITGKDIEDRWWRVAND
jgi:hypothetical protein